MNWNIRLAYIQTISFSIGMGIIQIAFSIYVIQGLGQTNLILGFLFTAQGLASTIFVFPSGFLADKYRRDTLIRTAVLFGVLSQLSLIYSTFLGETPQLALNVLFLAQSLGGLAWGLSGPAGQALIADSIESGNRSKVFANMHYVGFLASAAGPFAAAGITVILGDTWGIEVLKSVIIFGALSSLIAWAALVLVSDNKTLIAKEERYVSSLFTPLFSKRKRKEKEKEIEEKKEIPPREESFRQQSMFFGRSFSYDVYVPSIIVISGIIIGFGAGATVAFFPVLFADPVIGYDLKPFFTFVIFGATNVVSGFMGLAAQRLIKNFGRIGSMFVVQGLAIICLLGLTVNLAFYMNKTLSLNFSVILLVLFFISRNALMNASSPISRSIVMDCVPPLSRAKWNSLETLAWGMFWSVSASIGGFIVDSYGFLYVFIFTVTLYTIATLMLLLIRNRVPKESVLTHTYQLGKLKSKNRVVLPSISVTDDLKFADVSGQLSSSAISYYAKTAEGGAGLVYLEPAYISNSGKSHSYQVGIHDDYVIPRMIDVVKQIHENGALAGIRLRHAGAATTSFLSGDQPLAPSAITIGDKDPSRPLTDDELSHLITCYVQAAKRAVNAGFDIVEVSACVFPDKFSNLLGQFFSPDFNLRKDKYGGTLRNRLLFPLDVVRAIKTNLPPEVMLSFHLTLPFQGLSIEDLLEVASSLEKKGGIDLLSMGYSGSWSQRVGFDDLCEQIRKNVKSLPLILHGDFNVESAETALRKGQADFIGFEKLIQEDRSFPQTLR